MERARTYLWMKRCIRTFSSRVSQSEPINIAGDWVWQTGVRCGPELTIDIVSWSWASVSFLKWQHPFFVRSTLDWLWKHTRWRTKCQTYLNWYLNWYYAYTEYWTLCKQISCLLDVSGKFLPLILSMIVPCTFSKPLEAGRLRRFRTTGKHMR